MSLKEYHRKRNFKKTSEPTGAGRSRKVGKPPNRRRKRALFVIQEHHARRLHWDFRLEIEGVLRSWAVTKEPSLDPALRRLAIETEDHPIEYARFHGSIPKGEYGAGQVDIWDHGTYEITHPLSDEYDQGVIKVVLRGKRLKGEFVLVRTRGTGPKSQWLFFKARPKTARLRIPRISRTRSA
jgi:bifunctional non-homologous end joining protein LigD